MNVERLENLRLDFAEATSEYDYSVRQCMWWIDHAWMHEQYPNMYPSMSFPRGTKSQTPDGGICFQTEPGRNYQVFIPHRDYSEPLTRFRRLAGRAAELLPEAIRCHLDAHYYVNTASDLWSAMLWTSGSNRWVSTEQRKQNEVTPVKDWMLPVPYYILRPFPASVEILRRLVTRPTEWCFSRPELITVPLNLPRHGTQAPTRRKTGKRKPKGARPASHDLIIAALCKHHQYDNGSCKNLEPVGVRKLAEKLPLKAPTISEFFSRHFQGHSQYRCCCRRKEIAGALKLLNGEVSPHHLFSTPPGEEDRRGE